MAADDLDELIRSCEALSVPAILTALDTHTFVGVNDRAAAIFGVPASKLVGDDVLAHIDPRDREAARTGYAAMAAKAIDGYQVRRRIVLPDGTVMRVSVWGRRLEASGQLYGLWVLVPESGTTTGADRPVDGSAPDLVLAVTDHDWNIEYVNADAHLLGIGGSDLRGFPLLGLVHPSVAAEFLEAAARAVADHLSVTVMTRIRCGPDEWADRYCLLVPMCEHQPPRLGVVITACPSASPPEGLLGERVRQATLEGRAMHMLQALPLLARLPQGSELSARQTEIVARLVAGERVPEIARALFLSPSTVRNHLVAIYRKFAVHSQAELLATLLRDVAHFD